MNQVEYTLSILKPDVVSRKIVGQVIQYLENAGLDIVASKFIQLTQEQAKSFYKEHENRPFFSELIEYITSGPVIVQVLRGPNAIKKNRDIIGATNPKEAEKGTIRGDLAESIDANLVHGSDSKEAAEREINMFFAKIDIFE